MSDLETAVATEPTATVKKVVKKAAVKAVASAKKAVKKTVKPAKKVAAKTKPAKKAATNGAVERKTDTSKTPTERCNMALAGLRKLGATSPLSGVNVASIAAAAKLSEFDAYCAVWSKGKLQTGGFVGQGTVEGVKGAAFYLTKSGAKNNLE